ncbi:hypothetical protein [Nioella aestuarii]|uniref:hypothetical protein n=1 Tax=Nioella aestuarii TaxID=1662864 RepID=UPI003D7FD2C5
MIGPQKSVVLGAMAGSEERATDRIFVVEDASARDFVEAVFECAAVDLLPEKRPKYKVISAGSWTSAIDLFRALRAQNDTISRVSLLMDGDVEDTMQEQRQVNPNNEHVSFYFSEGESKLVIPFTPECFLVLMVSRDREAYLKHLRGVCGDFQINLPTQIVIPRTDGRSEREPCKAYYRALCRELTNADISDCSSKVFSAAMRLAKDQYRNDWGRIRMRVH